jgi:ATP-dependent Zn protease
MISTIQDDIDEDKILSYHEAGHAIVAWKLGLRILKMSVGTIGDWQGSCQDSLRPFCIVPENMVEDDWKSAGKKAQILVAGEIAEEFYYIDHNSGAAEYCSAKDRGEIADLSVSIFLSDLPKARKWVEERESAASEILGNNWEKVRKLATLLRRKRSLSGDDVMDLLNANDQTR